MLDLCFHCVWIKQHLKFPIWNFQGVLHTQNVFSLVIRVWWWKAAPPQWVHDIRKHLAAPCGLGIWMRALQFDLRRAFSLSMYSLADCVDMVSTQCDGEDHTACVADTSLSSWRRVITQTWWLFYFFRSPHHNMPVASPLSLPEHWQETLPTPYYPYLFTHRSVASVFTCTDWS